MSKLEPTCVNRMTTRFMAAATQEQSYHLVNLGRPRDTRERRE